MQLLVSVMNGDETAAALAGGADIIDAKDPGAGPLGAVACDVLREIRQAARHAPLLTAALGDAADEATVERSARAFASEGVQLVKLGFAGTRTRSTVATLLRAANRGADEGGHGRCGVVAVAYADADQVASLSPDDLLDAAADASCTGVLLDTARKDRPGLLTLLSRRALSAWIERAHVLGLQVAIAGRLQLNDLELVREAGADIAGVRGAACDGGRTGIISVERVRALVKWGRGSFLEDTRAKSPSVL